MKTKQKFQNTNYDSDSNVNESKEFCFDDDFRRFNGSALGYVIPNQYCYCGRFCSMYKDKLTNFNLPLDDTLYEMNKLTNDVLELDQDTVYATKQSLMLSQFLEFADTSTVIAKASDNTNERARCENTLRSLHEPPLSIMNVHENQTQRSRCHFLDKRLVSLFRSVALYWFFCLNTVLAKGDIFRRKSGPVFDCQTSTSSLTTFCSNEFSNFNLSPVVLDYLENNICDEYFWQVVSSVTLRESEKDHRPSCAVIRLADNAKPKMFMLQDLHYVLAKFISSVCRSSVSGDFSVSDGETKVEEKFGEATTDFFKNNRCTSKNWMKRDDMVFDDEQFSDNKNESPVTVTEDEKEMDVDSDVWYIIDDMPCFQGGEDFSDGKSNEESSDCEGSMYEGREEAEEEEDEDGDDDGIKGCDAMEEVSSDVDTSSQSDGTDMGEWADEENSNEDDDIDSYENEITIENEPLSVVTDQHQYFLPQGMLNNDEHDYPQYNLWYSPLISDELLSSKQSLAEELKPCQQARPEFKPYCLWNSTVSLEGDKASNYQVNDGLSMFSVPYCPLMVNPVCEQQSTYSLWGSPNIIEFLPSIRNMPSAGEDQLRNRYLSSESDTFECFKKPIDGYRTTQLMVNNGAQGKFFSFKPVMSGSVSLTDRGAFKYYKKSRKSFIIEPFVASKSAPLGDDMDTDVCNINEDSYLFMPIQPAFRVEIDGPCAMQRSVSGSLYVQSRKYMTFKHELDEPSKSEDVFQPKFQVNSNDKACQTDDLPAFVEWNCNLFYGDHINLFDKMSSQKRFVAPMQRPPYFALGEMVKIMDKGVIGPIDVTIPPRLDFGYIF